MIQPLVDLRSLLRGLHSHQVQYVVTGALAMVFYGYVRNSEDLDIIVAPDRGNLDRVADWLISVNAVLDGEFAPREHWGLQKGSNATALTELGQVDVLQRLPGLPEWESVVEQAEHYAVDDMTIAVINRATWAEMKRRRGSHQDLADIEAVEWLGEV